MKITIKVPIKTKNGLGELIYEDNFDFGTEYASDKRDEFLLDWSKIIKNRLDIMRDSLEDKLMEY